MSADYEPGTVAKATVLGVEGVRVARYDAGWVRLDDPDIFYSDKDCDDMVTDVCPLVVLDFTPSPAHLPQLLRLLRDNFWPDLADQIEAQTKPPRIPEPGTWGIVKARLTSIPGGREWTAVRTPKDGWRVDDGGMFEWDELIDPVLIREGVES
jgi:hypothetical protein